MNATATISRAGLKIATPCRYPHYTPVQKLMRKANTGDAEAQFELAQRYDKGNGVKKSYSEAAKWYRMAAEQGHEKAQHCLSSCYAFGWGVEKDENASIQWRVMEETNRYKEHMALGDWLFLLVLIVFGIPAVVLKGNSKTFVNWPRPSVRTNPPWARHCVCVGWRPELCMN